MAELSLQDMGQWLQDNREEYAGTEAYEQNYRAYTDAYYGYTQPPQRVANDALENLWAGRYQDRVTTALGKLENNRNSADAEEFRELNSEYSQALLNQRKYGFTSRQDTLAQQEGLYDTSGYVKDRVVQAIPGIAEQFGDPFDMYNSMSGQIYQELKNQQIPITPEVVSEMKKWAAGLASADVIMTVGSLGTAKVISSVLGKAGAAAATQQFLKHLASKGLITTTVKAGVLEGLTEGFQEGGIMYAASTEGAEYTQEEVLNRIGEGTVIGGAAGSSIRVGSSAAIKTGKGAVAVGKVIASPIQTAKKIPQVVEKVLTKTPTGFLLNQYRQETDADVSQEIRTAKQREIYGITEEEAAALVSNIARTEEAASNNNDVFDYTDFNTSIEMSPEQKAAVNEFTQDVVGVIRNDPQAIGRIVVRNPVGGADFIKNIRARSINEQAYSHAQRIMAQRPDTGKRPSQLAKELGDIAQQWIKNRIRHTVVAPVIRKIPTMEAYDTAYSLQQAGLKRKAGRLVGTSIKERVMGTANRTIPFLEGLTRRYAETDAQIREIEADRAGQPLELYTRAKQLQAQAQGITFKQALDTVQAQNNTNINNRIRAAQAELRADMENQFGDTFGELVTLGEFQLRKKEIADGTGLPDAEGKTYLQQLDEVPVGDMDGLEEFDTIHKVQNTYIRNVEKEISEMGDSPLADAYREAFKGATTFKQFKELHESILSGEVGVDADTDTNSFTGMDEDEAYAHAYAEEDKAAHSVFADLSQASMLQILNNLTPDGFATAMRLLPYEDAIKLWAEITRHNPYGTEAKARRADPTTLDLSIAEAYATQAYGIPLRNTFARAGNEAALFESVLSSGGIDKDALFDALNVEMSEEAAELAIENLDTALESIVSRLNGDLANTNIDGEPLVDNAGIDEMANETQANQFRTANQLMRTRDKLNKLRRILVNVANHQAAQAIAISTPDAAEPEEEEK